MDINQSKNQKLQYWSAAAMLCMLTYVLYTTFGVISVFALLLLPFALYSTIKASTAFVILFILFSYFRLHEAFPVLYNFKIPKMRCRFHSNSKEYLVLKMKTHVFDAKKHIFIFLTCIV